MFIGQEPVLYNSEMCGLIFGHIYSLAQAQTRGYYENLSKNNLYLY
jgi:hypothetical protein